MDIVIWRQEKRLWLPKKKDRPWDGRSRIPTKKYKEEFNRIFNVRIDRGSEDDIEKENEEYLEEIKNKL